MTENHQEPYDASAPTCECHDRYIDHAYDDDIDQYEIATPPETKGLPVPRWSDESMREYAEYMKANEDG